MFRAISAIGLGLTTYALLPSDAEKTKKINEEANRLLKEKNNDILDTVNNTSIKIDDIIKDLKQTHINLSEYYDRIKNGETLSQTKK